MINALHAPHRREIDEPPAAHDGNSIFSSPEVLSKYLERLEATTLPFAIAAAQIIDLVPPQQGNEYVVLDDACGTGAAVEWIVDKFSEANVPIAVTATDCSAVMINEVENRAKRLDWGDCIKWAVMDAQVLLCRQVH